MSNERVDVLAVPDENRRYWAAQPLVTRPFNTARDAVSAATAEIGEAWRATHYVRETASGWFVSAMGGVQ